MTETVKTTSDRFQAPAMTGDVGYNLPAVRDYVIPAGEYAQVHTGIHLEPPPGTWYLILPRSSANRTGKLVVLPGVIDNGYRGELTVMVHNVTPPPGLWNRLVTYALWALGRIDIPTLNERLGAQAVLEGVSLGQVVFLPALVFPIQQVDNLSQTERGANGYGSTGQSVGV